MSDEVEADANDECREIYARFGLAYYQTECLHRGLVNALLLLPADPDSTTRSWIDEGLERTEKMTMGELVPKVASLVPETLHGPLDWALDRRNYLAHGFWYERTHEMLEPEGRRGLIEFLSEIADRMHEVSEALGVIVQDRFGALGVSPEQFEQAYRDVSVRGPEPPTGREAPRIDERLTITDAWLIPRDGGITVLVLRDAVDSLWQLGELGLGRCALDGPNEDWPPFEPLQRLLPAAIVARPKGATPLNYKLHVSTGALLVVERMPPGPMRFRLRPAKPLRQQPALPRRG